MRGVNGVPATVKIGAVPETFRADVPRVDMLPIRQNFDAYFRRKDDCGEAERAMANGRVVLDALLEKHLL